MLLVQVPVGKVEPILNAWAPAHAPTRALLIDDDANLKHFNHYLATG